MNSENTKITNFFKFESLRIYHKAVDFANAIITLANSCKNESHRLLMNMFANEAMQITTNIIEGQSVSKTAFIEHLQKAKSNIGCCVAMNTIAFKQRLIDEIQENDIRNELMELTKMIGALIISFQKHDPVTSFEMQTLTN